MSKCDRNHDTYHKKKCHKVCRGPRGLRGRQGPTGPQGESGPLGPTQRTLKVQLVDGIPTPIFIEGFSWENDVPQPPGWPVAGSFSFYKATMLDVEPYGIGELFNVNGGITHNDTGILHQIMIAHYRGTNILDYHTASSQVVGVEDSLTAQSLQNGMYGDCFYFAISPDVGDLTHFNYNLGSLKCQPQFLFPHDLPIGFIYPSGKQIPIGCSFGKVTEDFSAGLTIYGAGGGGGAGESTINNAGGTFIGRGGGGGGAGAIWTTTGSGNEDIDFKKGDKIEFYLGHGGIGGSATGANPDGAKGQESWVKLTRDNNTDFIGFSWPPGSGLVTTAPNPIPGGCGGIGGTGGGHGGTGFDAGGGGGGAGLINGSPNSPGSGGDTVLPPAIGGNPGSDGGTSPRNGGKGGMLPTPPTPPGLGVGGAGGGIGISSKMGSGGGGGSAFQSAFHVVDPENPNSSSGGNGGMPGITGSSGMSGAASQGGGGGGSGGLGPQDSFILGGNGGNGGRAIVYCFGVGF